MENSWTYYILFSLPVLIFLYSKSKPATPISSIDGPVAQVVGILGNFWEYYHFGVGVHEFKWQEKYGAVYRIKALFGEDRLIVADPKALQYIYQGAGTKWLKPELRREFGRIFLGRGIAWAQGDDHKRHRKILAPAFTNIRTHSMIPVFSDTAERMCQRWQEELGTAPLRRIEVTDLLLRATLDAVGEVGFHYKFNSLENNDNPLAKAYQSLLVNSFGLPSKGKIFAQHALGYLPVSIIQSLEKLPSRSLAGLKNVAREGHTVAMQLVNEKKAAVSRGGVDVNDDEDFLDLIVKANLSEHRESQLSEEELSAQMRHLTVLAYDDNSSLIDLTYTDLFLLDETTANSIAFVLYEISKHPEVQEKIRQEIVSLKMGIKKLSANDLELMTYTRAVMKEGLRLHPVVYGPFLYPAEDDVIPLSRPIRTIDGRMISEIPIAKGQIVHVSVSGYNRLKDIWGETAHEFHPERWLQPSEGCKDGSGSPFGVYSNLGNFVGGAQSCLGWRFAIYEIQTFLVHILSNFKLTYPGDLPRVIRATSGVMAPVLEGEEEKGKRLVLQISLI
ncbi:hypothetical protein D9757_009094 [Collybiopsis confluens]|uniref:Cytochrome P450 n=1 Tax=Collybiopsis confluens TaxID=2823264 RepID=A0A8H5M335_9AGAR|nr:hypothetical protein D9757_009094 [Collybiopsis confluens]